MPPSFITALQAVTPAQGSAAASMSLRCSGVLISACFGKMRYSVRTPSAEPPRAERIFVSLGSPPVQLSKKLPMTRSPAANSRTPGPINTPSPAGEAWDSLPREAQEQILAKQNTLTAVKSVVSVPVAVKLTLLQLARRHGPPPEQGADGLQAHSSQ